jgi:diguanylate cyclase (GGDEF)-like protein
MLEGLRKNWRRQETLEQRVFWLILAVVSIVRFASLVLTVFEQINYIAVSLCVLNLVVCVITGFIVKKTSSISTGFLLLIVFLACITLPALFFLCGGIRSAMPYFLLTGPFMSSFIVNRKAKIAGAATSIAVGVSVIVLSWQFPEWVTAPPSETVVYIDIALNYLFFGAALFGVCSYAVRAYMRERRQKDEFLAKLEDLSRRDDLTGLYNRRYFIQYLEDVVWLHRDQFYVAMLDIDGFAQINEKYGKVFGDSVICSVGSQIGRSLNEEYGERAVRFSGETFVCVLKGESEIEAFTKADQIRESVSNMQWGEFPFLHVTVSGGFISCRVGDPYDKRAIVRSVDDLLYAVKTKGVNQIKVFGGRNAY